MEKIQVFQNCMDFNFCSLSLKYHQIPELEICIFNKLTIISWVQLHYDTKTSDNFLYNGLGADCLPQEYEGERGDGWNLFTYAKGFELLK